MSAFVCILDRSGARVQSEALETLAEPLTAHGLTTSSHCHGPVGIAVLHAPRPEAERRHGPLVSRDSRLAVAVAGRFGLAEEDPSDRGVGDPITIGCAAWALANDVHDRPARLATVSGAFALIAADPDAGWMHVARDHLGSLGVCYYLDERWFVAASDPAAILRHEAVGDELDERSIARFLGFQFRHDERTFFRQVRELPPAHGLRVSARENRREQFWQFRKREGLAREPAADIHEEFLSRLRRSVALETGDLDPSRVALSLSGGLDSTAIAAVAPRGVRAFSWTFEETPEGDERANVEAVSRNLGMPVHWVDGDGLYPLSGDFADRFVRVGSPRLNAFAALKARLYEEARSEGCQRVLVGDGGDALYLARDYWLRDLLRHEGPGALPEVAAVIRRAAKGDTGARNALRRLVPLRIAWRRLRRPRIPWLTDEARALLPAETFSPTLPPELSRHRYELSVGAKNVELEAEERRLFSRLEIERSNPFWSWPLLELTMQLPATWYQRGDRSKILSREALRGLLPEEVLESRRQGLLGAFFLRGIEENRRWLKDGVFDRPRSDWQRWVDRSWVEPYLSRTSDIALGHTILWLVTSYELWCRRLLRGV